MGYDKLYREKTIKAENAVKVVQAGDWIDYGWCCGTPVELDRALAARYEELSDVKVRGGILLDNINIMAVPDTSSHFLWNSWHMSGIERKMIEKGCAYYSPMRYSELARYYRENLPPIKAAFFQVASMNEDGWFSFGLSASHMRAVCDVSEHIFIEVNKNMPYCMGSEESAIHINEVNGIVEGLHAHIPEMKTSETTDIDRIVAEKIVSLIPDGACLQLGIGGMPNAVGSLIASSDLKNLGIHTEMYVDGFAEIVKSGKINGSNKNINKGKQVFSFAAGSAEMYELLDNNPDIISAPINYTNDVRTISQISNFVSINNAVDCDLFGQVNSESFGIKHISGSGGQQDFVLGAYLSEGGKSFICCSSTKQNPDGTVKSRISPVLNSGSIVTDTRTNVHYLVTEYGVVNLKGASTWERAEKIISIAHPDFREELITAAEDMKIWRKSNQR